MKALLQRMPSPLFIVNSVAGGREVARHRDQILAESRRVFPDLRWVETEYPGHAIKLAKDANLSATPDVVVIGGDGTIHEVVNGLFEGASESAGSTLTSPRPRCRLGIINFGRGGDFVRTLRTPSDIVQALALIKIGHTRSIDVGKTKFVLAEPGGTNTPIERYFINSCSVGLGGRVAQSVQRVRSSLPPAFVYGQALLKNFATYRREAFRIDLDGQVVSNGPTTAFLACNGRYSGRGMLWSAEASLDDGLLDILWVQDLSWTQLLKNFHRIYDGSIGLVPEVKKSQARKIHLRPSRPTVLETDGETHWIEDLEISVLPQSLQVFVS